METKRELKRVNVGDAAVEGLLNGIIAGIVMAVFLLIAQVMAGVAPLAVLGYFDVTSNASPLVGLLSHLAAAGVYGVVFGLLAVMITRAFGTRVTRLVWIAMGVLYGLLVFGIAEWIILPRTDSPLAELPSWVFAAAHMVYGAVLGFVMSRDKS